MRVAIAGLAILAAIAMAGQASAEGNGTITGVVLSSVGSHAVPEALVTLYDEYGNVAGVPENPQLSSNGTGNNAGVYTFYDVPPGAYTVTAEKGDTSFFAVANLDRGTATANIVLPEYVETAPAYQPPPTPSPRPFYYFVPVRIKKTPGQGTGNEGLSLGLAALGGIGALAIFAIRKRQETE